MNYDFAIRFTTAAAMAGALLMPAAASAQTTQKLTANKTNDYGLVYALPLTAVDVTIEAERTVKRPGEFFRYSGKHLNIDPVTADQESWVIKSVTITSHGVADSEQQYMIQFKSGSTPFMLLDSNGFPITINADDYVLPPKPALPVSQEAKPTILETPAAQSALTEEMVQSKSSAKRAELAAAKIFELRQSRNDIISGQADQMPSDGKAMQLALDNISLQEEALTAMFTGTSQVSTEVSTFTIIPDGSDRLKMVIGRLSQTEGLVDADDLSGEPIYIEITATRTGEYPVNERGEERKAPKGGLAYNIPGEACVNVIFDGKVLASDNVELAQSGVVFALEPGLFSDKRAPAYAIFDPATGALKELGTKE